MISVESPHNDTYKKLLSLTSSKGLKKEGLFLLSGEKLIHEYLKTQQSVNVVYEILTADLAPLQADNAKRVSLSPSLFDEIDVLGTHFNILVLQQLPLPTLSLPELAAYQPHGIEIVLPTGDPGNLGALIRSCEAFGVRRILLTKEAAHPFLPKTVKASAGSVLRVDMLQAPALAEFPRNCIALDMHGENINDFVWPQNTLLVVGEEGAGLGNGNQMFEKLIRIPTQGVESLNAVVAASIALADKARKG